MSEVKMINKRKKLIVTFIIMLILVFYLTELCTGQNSVHGK